MDGFDLPDDLKDDIEVIYLDDDEEFEEDIEGDDMDDETSTPGKMIDSSQVVDLSTLSFNKHTKSVFCCDLSTDSTLAVTGGEDDMAYLWSTTTGEVLLECTGHKDSVTEVKFNYDATLVATGDMAGLVQVWSVKDKNLVWCNEGDDLEWLLWHQLANVLVIGTQSGDVYIWQIPQGQCKVLPSHGVGSTCGRVLACGKRLVVGYGDGQLKLWDIKTSTAVWQLSEVEPAGITSLAVSSGGDSSSTGVIVVAPTAAVVKVSDGRVVSRLLLDGEREIECVLVLGEMGIVVTGSLSGQLCVWETARAAIRHQARVECAVTVLRLSNSSGSTTAGGGRLCVGATDGAVYVCDVRTGVLVETLTGHLADVLSVATAANGKFLLSTSDDCSAKIFLIKSTE